LASRHKFPRTSLTTAEGATTGVKLVLKKKNERLEKKEEGYDELDDEEDRETHTKKMEEGRC
jgi:hypothetical protein